MDKRIVRVCGWLLFGALLAPSAFGDLPQGCNAPEAIWTTSGGQSKMNGVVWTDVVQTNDGNFILVSAERSKVILLNSSGLVAKEFQLPDPKLRPTQLAVQPNGRILVAGIHTEPTSGNTKLYKLQIVGF